MIYLNVATMIKVVHAGSSIGRALILIRRNTTEAMTTIIYNSHQNVFDRVSLIYAVD
jgi:hypothetical protein